MDKTDSVKELFESLKNCNNELDHNKVYDLVKKYVDLQNKSGAIFELVTKGIIKNSDYPEEVIQSVIQSVQQDFADKSTVCDDMIHLFGTDEGSKQLIQEYFGKLD